MTSSVKYSLSNKNFEVPTLARIFLDSPPRKTHRFRCGGDAALGVAAVLAEQLPPVGLQTQPKLVLQRCPGALAAWRAHNPGPADVFLPLQPRLVTSDAHVGLDGLVLEVVSHEVFGRPSDVDSSFIVSIRRSRNSLASCNSAEHRVDVGKHVTHTVGSVWRRIR